MTAQLVRDIAATAFTDAVDVRFIIETLEAGNTPTAIAANKAADTARVAQCVGRSLWSRLLILVARAYAPARAGDLHVQRAFDLLADPAIKSEVEKSGDPAALAEALGFWGKCRDDHRLHSFLAFRDKRIAHWGKLDEKIPLIIINDVFAVSRNTAAVFERLAQGAGVVTLSLDSQLMNFGEQAQRFWEGKQGSLEARK